MSNTADVFDCCNGFRQRLAHRGLLGLLDDLPLDDDDGLWRRLYRRDLLWLINDEEI
jgi:hypothetical protein